VTPEPVAAENPELKPVAQATAPPVARAVVEPVAQPKLRLVQPVAHKAKKRTRATGGTRHKPKETSDLETPSWPGCEWRKSGSGYEVWRRAPAISENGKRSSKRSYMAYYSRKAVEAFYEREKKTDIRRITGTA